MDSNSFDCLGTDPDRFRQKWFTLRICSVCGSDRSQAGPYLMLISVLLAACRASKSLRRQPARFDAFRWLWVTSELRGLLLSLFHALQMHSTSGLIAWRNVAKAVIGLRVLCVNPTVKKKPP